MKTTVIETKATWNRDAYLILKNNKVTFDCSDGEYGPIEFDLSILENAILEHKQKLQNENKTITQSHSD